MNITLKNNPKEFNNFLFEKIGIDRYEYKFLKEYIKTVQNGIRKLYDDSIINTTENGWILILHGDVLLVFGNNWNKTQFLEIKDLFDLNKFPNYLVNGESTLVNELINFFNIKKHSIYKERVFYQSNKIETFIREGVMIELGKMNDHDKLSKMLQQYYHEEYKGKNDKSLKEMQQRMFYLIQSSTIYTLKNTLGQLLCFCTIIDPDIGILFTNIEYRRLGYGKVILSYCSELLEKKNNIVYSMTDKEEVASDYVCKAVGFKPYYEYTMTEINFD